MRFSSAFFAATVVLPVFGAPTLVPITKRGGTLKENSYIITLKDGVSQPGFVESFKKGLTQPDSAVVHTYSVINGFSAIIAPSDLSLVRGMPEIASIDQDKIVSLPDHDNSEEVDALPIGEGQPSPPPYGNTHNDKDGEGVVIYGLDTGIYTEHECFEGRASWGWSAYIVSGRLVTVLISVTVYGAKISSSQVQVDDHGHGTHTAGTAVCKDYGVATKAHIVAVKVMNAAGVGSTSDIVKGVDYACGEYQQHQKPTIVTMSIGGGADDLMDKAVRNCIAKGVHFTVAAGNDNKDAESYSPARVEEANTAGAVDSSNAKVSFSNYGSVVDIQAPGVNIVSAGNIGRDSKKTMSGTSMATPYVAGILAVALSNHGQMSPAGLSKQLEDNAKPVCTGMPAGTTNNLATRW
ncbi:subtilisin-like serine protease [Ceratobasidium sp. 423]|nr:subtilisin-like serine protease [Ceratobasidium sp. 423]